ncbi:MAG: Glutamate synthase (NADPH) small chain [Candidatus Hydrogenedentes bacterium ADurb.Bin179]|nr:MAG: Glutamate synthase (NADPH) small chain [Candidatus Hydrogenedentes bacterium ADurb.Bin179]
MADTPNKETTPAEPKPKKERPPRQAMPEQEPEDRARNFYEVPYGYTPELAMLEAGRCLTCKKPKCVDGCPVHVDIPGFIALIQEGKFIEAAHHLKEQNALPAICGRVCPQEEQCEQKCILGLKGEPVAVGRLERFVADYERQSGAVATPELPPKTGKKVAIIGAGPAGLTAAGDLIRMGHDVTVFEALQETGGVLVYGIPEFRLPKEIVKAEVNFLKQMGVEFVMDFVVGRNATIRELLDEEGYSAVFIGTGAGLPAFLGIPGENLVGVYSANEYLTRSNLMKSYLFPKYDTPPIRRERVAVVGGGNVAMDSARTALRLGGDVHIVYRRAKEQMPARIEEIHHAEQEGVKMKLLTNPKRILGDERHRVTGIECIQMELGEPDDSGRRRPVPVKGSEFVIEVDTVVIAIGNNPNPLIPRSMPDLATSKWGTIIVDEETMATSVPGVFAAGDIVSGAATVISAMGQARTAADTINKYLNGEEIRRPEMATTS